MWHSEGIEVAVVLPGKVDIAGAVVHGRVPVVVPGTGVVVVPGKADTARAVVVPGRVLVARIPAYPPERHRILHRNHHHKLRFDKQYTLLLHPLLA